MQKARRHPDIIGTPTACKRTVSGTISLPCSGCFSPFLHSTGSLSVSQEYLALPDGAGSFRQDFSGPAVLRILLVLKLIYVYGTITLYGRHFPVTFHFNLSSHIAVLQPQLAVTYIGLGSSPFARHYSGNHYCFLFLRVLRCFSSPGLLPIAQDIRLQHDGLPHSEISGSNRICTSP